MDDFENKLGQILGNPEMMGKIMAMAQSFGSQDPQPEPPPQQEASIPEIDFATIQKLTGLMGKALSPAPSPYLSGNRIEKLEKAMRAAKLAGAATTFLGSHPHLFGR